MPTYKISEQMKNEIETMRKNKIILGDVPNSKELIIKINPNEIPLTTGDFWRMQHNNKFTKTWIDKDDFAKITGIVSTGEIFTAERCDEDLTDEEFKIYYKRHGITENNLKTSWIHGCPQESVIEGLTVYGQKQSRNKI